MKVYNTTAHEMETALAELNKQFDNNIVWKRFDRKSNHIVFTLTVKNSRDAGGRIGHTGRRIAAACWHVHGYFFERLFEVNPEAIIKSSDKTITVEGGNWQDWNIGSRMQPMYYSEACNCE